MAFGIGLFFILLGILGTADEWDNYSSFSWGLGCIFIGIICLLL